jgi:hypothetical protein
VRDHGGVADTHVVRPRRGRQTVADMARSLGLMALVIAALLFLGPARSLLFPGDDRMPAVDYTNAVHKFATLVGPGVPVPPTTSPTGWRATSASVSRSSNVVRLHIGWAVPGTHYAGLDEATGDPAELVRAVLGSRGGSVVGAVDIAGSTWQRRISARGEQALTRTVGDVTVVVTGNARPDDLARLAALLR